GGGGCAETFEAGNTGFGTATGGVMRGSSQGAARHNPKASAALATPIAAQSQRRGVPRPVTRVRTFDNTSGLVGVLTAACGPARARVIISRRIGSSCR